MVNDNADRLRRWRIVIFLGSWLSYVAYYLTRKNYAVAQPKFMDELGWTEERVGIIITAYLTTYAIGQFVNGALGDKLGARFMLGVGFAGTAVMSLFLGFAESITTMALLFGANGLFQSMGWPSVCKLVASWFPVKVRGRVMGFWGTCYPVGDAVATAFATAIMAALGWRWAFWLPAIVVAVLGVFLVVVLRNFPSDVGLQDDAEEQSDEKPSAEHSFTESLRHVTDRRVLILGGSYFCIKFVRYTIIFWSGVYLVRQLAFTPEQAGYLQVPFPLVGLLGSIAAGVVSDLVFKARRGPPATIMMGGLAVALLIFLALPPTAVWVGSGLALIGFLVFGPDLLISGPAAIDFGSKEAAATVAGFVNGVGSTGAALSGVVVGFVAANIGWHSVFHLLVGITAIGALTTSLLWRATADK